MAAQLLNTLYVMSEGAYAHLKGDTVEVLLGSERVVSVPLVHLMGIVVFAGATITQQLMMRCASEGRAVTFLDHGGRFRARVVGPTSGNVLLRKAQYDAQYEEMACREIARAIVAGKLRNSRQNLLRAARERTEAICVEKLRAAVSQLERLLVELRLAADVDQIRGIEGRGAAVSFEVFGLLITRPKSEFAFAARTRRPPRDRVNALLSFVYALLQTDCTSALETVGLDPQIGFLHAMRPGRPALALDLMEEFRPAIAERLTLALINRSQVRPAHFEHRDGGAVLLNAEGRRIVITEYQRRKREEVTHPALKQVCPIGLLPHVQSRLLARHLRGDLDHYVPYLVR